MKRLAFALLLLSTSGWAEWTQVGTSEERGGYFIYAELATICRGGDTIKMWSLFDFKTVQQRAGVAFLSSKTQHEYDCAGERIRTLYFSWHSGNMGGGAVVYIDKNTKGWIPIAPGSNSEGLWNLACKQ